MSKPKFPPNPQPKIDNRSIPKGYMYIPGETYKPPYQKSKTSKNKAVDDDKNWTRIPNAPKGRRF